LAWAALPLPRNLITGTTYHTTFALSVLLLLSAAVFIRLAARVKKHVRESSGLTQTQASPR